MTSSHDPPAPHAYSLATLRDRYHWLPKDFVESDDGLLAAVVTHGAETPGDRAGPNRLLVYPRYTREPNGTLRKLSSAEAVPLISVQYPHYRWRSRERDVELTAIPPHHLMEHYRPEQAWQGFVRAERPIAILSEILGDLLPETGITGSYLVGASRTASDIDLVVYGLQNFDAVRQRLLAEVFHNQLGKLQRADWEQVFARRSGMSITFEEYHWHERRKNNKFLLEGRTIDVSCVDFPHPISFEAGHKLECLSLEARVVCDRDAFNTPAVYQVEHSQVRWLVSYTATYVGQAHTGEKIKARGMLEQMQNGEYRLVVGASREATGEWMRVVS